MLGTTLFHIYVNDIDTIIVSPHQIVQICGDYGTSPETTE